MEIASLGRILGAMAECAKRGADFRAESLGRKNKELLSAIALILQEGAQQCLEIAKDNEDNETA